VIVALPREVAPSENWMEPVAAAGEIVAVNVTGCPYVKGPAPAVRVIVVAAWTV
jgi:hypothetical protein